MGALAERRDVAEADLVAVAGDASLCAISRSGARVDGAKYAEGRLAALVEAQRRVARGAVVAEAVASALSVWRDQLEVAGGLGDVWVAYRTGGVDELEGLLADLS